ncbi:MAG: PHP domain-containing protein [Bacteroidales bacterium]|nr:PHP domain-containing protein [Bacteroidales bacterium]
MKADLHIHSRFSNDGELEIGDIIQKCRENRVNLFSVTDHNCIAGSRLAAGLSLKEKEIEFIPGIEIDCNYQGTDLHLLGYQINLSSNDFDFLEQNVRRKYFAAVPEMIKNLSRLGIEIDRAEVMGRSGGEPPSAELFAELLLEKPHQQLNSRLRPYLPGGERSDMPLINFYLDYFAQGKPAYVKIDHLPFEEALDLVRRNGGIPIVAHPGLNLEGREEMVHELLDRGAAGLEVFNNYHSREQVAWFAGETIKKGVLMTCGSDFHGNTKPRISLGSYLLLEPFGSYLQESLNIIRMHAEKQHKK